MTLHPPRHLSKGFCEILESPSTRTLISSFTPKSSVFLVSPQLIPPYLTINTQPSGAVA